MEHCKSCQTPLYPGALFCHNCGKQTERAKIICKECNNVNPEASRFCFRCGSPIDISYTPKPYLSPVFGLDFSAIPTLPKQIIDAFDLSLSLALEYENNTEKEALFLDTYEDCGFKQKYLEEASIRLTQEFEELYEERGKSAFSVIEKRLDQQFAQLYECFIIDYCNHLIPYPLPKKLLNFTDTTIRTKNLHSMIYHYLDIAVEHNVYHQAVEIPLPTLKNARKTFFSEAKLPPLYFVDLSILQNGKEGIILTSDAIYWKSCFHKSAHFPYSSIENIHYFPDRIEVNGIYLHVADGYNYHLFRLLVRLKTMAML